MKRLWNRTRRSQAPSTASTSVDEAIGNYLSRMDPESEVRLAASGEEALRRMLDLFYGRSADNPDLMPQIQGRERGDRWSAALGVVAAGNPAAFIDAMAEQKLGTTELSILGSVNDPRSAQLLCEHLDAPDWLIRYNAVAALRRLGDDQGRPCIDRALADPNLAVRDEAIGALSNWDADRAIELYEAQLTEDGLTPLLRQSAHAALQELRSGHPVPNPFST